VNRILLRADEVRDDSAVLEGRRARHVLDVIGAEQDDELRVGVLGGALGRGRVVAQSATSVTLEIELCEDPPSALPVTLFLALPRPKIARRLLIDCAAAGVKDIHLFGAWKVDKSYWDSPLLADDAIAEHLILGLEQGGDTVMPVVKRHRLFKPFVEDRLPDLVRRMRAFVAHPAAGIECPRAVEGSIALAVGPERGLIDYEVERLSDAGFERVSLGARTVRVEAAVAMLLGRLA
jgi:16S rRNA (uracil1498-N3)-methyltransferase